MTNPEASHSGYKIGAVSKLTGISPDTLRIWERRYAAVTPLRSAGGGRLYTAEDIARLKLIRRLVDQGDSIGVVAALSHDELQARLDETRSVEAIATPSVPCRLVVVGELLSLKLEAEMDSLPGITMAASYDSLRAFEADTGRDLASGCRLACACERGACCRCLSFRHQGQPGSIAEIQMQHAACAAGPENAGKPLHCPDEAALDCANGRHG